MIKLPMEASINLKPVEQLFILLYGQPKIGKTEFSHHAGLGRSLYLATEAGQDFVPTFNLELTSWQQFIETIAALKGNRGALPYSSVVVDTIDNLHKFCAEAFTKSKNIEHESDLPMGKGYSMVNRIFFNAVQELLGICRMRKWGCIFISHARDSIDGSGKIKPGIPTTSYATISAACDMILFMYPRNDKTAGPIRSFATKPSTLFDAGDRTGSLPAVLDLGKDGAASFEIFRAAYEKAIESKRNNQKT